jgi:tetratricopeptide (TPR) repeat protein
MLEKVVERDPANQDAWYHLSKLHGQLSKVYFERLQKEHPGSFHTFLARSHFFESGGKWEQAAEELSKAAALQPGNEKLKERVSWIARRAAGEAPALPAIDEFVGSTRYLYAPPEGEQIRSAYTAERSRPESAQAVKDAPQSLYELAESHQALSFLSSLWVFQTSPDSYRAHELRAESLEAAGKMEESISEYRKALALNPDLQTIHFAIGNLYWRRDMLDEALVELREELKVNPNDPQTNYEIGDSLLAQNKPEEAEKYYAAALQFAPQMAEAHLAMERIASARGDSVKALLHLKKAAEISPADPTPQYRLWTLYRKLGRSAEAQQARAAFEKLRADTQKSKPTP